MRWSKEMAEGMDDISFAIAMLEERRKKLTDTPVAKRLSSVIETLGRLKDASENITSALYLGESKEDGSTRCGYFVMDECPVIVESLSAVWDGNKVILPKVYSVKPETVRLYRGEKLKAAINENRSSYRQRKIIQVYSTEMLGMVTDMGRGEPTVDGKPSSRFIVIAKGCGSDSSKVVRCRLIESGDGAYLIHIVNDVDRTDELFSCPLNPEEAMKKFTEILQMLENGRL